jgi:V-type H+-transporting ATPase 16kDa proteolipid subunit
LSSLAAGLAIGIIGDAGVRALAQTDKIFIGMMLMLILAEAIALFGLIISIMLLQG